MQMVKKVTIIGAGQGAFAAAADLTSRGYDVTLYSDSSHEKTMHRVLETKVIKCRGVGPVGDFPLVNVTCDIEEALKDADLIMPIVPANAHVSIANELVEHIKPDSLILLNPGSTAGALIFAEIFRKAGKLNEVKIAELHTLPYATRKLDEETVNILLQVKMLYCSVFPAKYNNEVYAKIRGVFPGIEMVDSVLESSLNNGNAVSHPAAVVLNAGKIEYYGKHFHYKEGITPSVARVLQALDDERKEICKAWGYQELDCKERLYKMGYCPLRDNLYDTFQGSAEVFLPIEGPNTLEGRYLVEDVPFSLVGMIYYARLVGVETPIMDSVVHLASALKSENYWETGRTLEKMGLEGMTVEEIKRFVHEG